MPEPGFMFVWIASYNARKLVFTCPQCWKITIDPETIPGNEVLDDPTRTLRLKPRLGFCTFCDAFVRTPTDAT